MRARDLLLGLLGAFTAALLLLPLATARAIAIEPPLYHVDAIRVPLLIGQGQNDPRVTIVQADSMVKALRAANHEVAYVGYPDEGHGFER